MFDFLDSVGKFIGDNAKWLKPVTNAVVGAVGAGQQGNHRSNILDATEAAIRDNYAREQSQAQADAEYEAQYGNWAAGQRARSAAAAAANRNAAAAAAAATRANAMKARKKGDQIQIKGLQSNLDLYRPFKDTALELLPVMKNTYMGGANALNALAPSFVTPQALNATLLPQLAVNQRIPMSSKLGG